MLSTPKIKLLSLGLQATHEPKPHYDRIVTSLVVSVGGKPLTSPDIPAAQVGKHVYCGFTGPGSFPDYTVLSQ